MRRSTAARGGGTFTELARPRRVLSGMFGGGPEDDYFFATVCAPAVIIALFVCYVVIKDRHKRL